MNKSITIFAFIFLISIIGVSALEINMTACGTADVFNLDNVTINLMNSVNVGLNGICINMLNATNVVINGNGYTINSTVTGNQVSTGIMLQDLTKDGTGFANITVKDLNFSGKLSRPFYLNSQDKIDGLIVDNITYNASILATTGAQFFATNNAINHTINNLQLLNSNIYSNSSFMQSVFRLDASPTNYHNLTNFKFENNTITMYVAIISMSSSSNGLYNYQNLTFTNNNLTGTNNNQFISTMFDNSVFTNNIFTYNPFPYVNIIGPLAIGGYVGEPKFYFTNNTFNNVFIVRNSPPSPTNYMYGYGNHFGQTFLNNSNEVKNANINLYFNLSNWNNNTGWLPPSYVITGFYDYENVDVRHLRYISASYPEYVYNFMLYNGTNGGYYYNNSILTFNQNITYFANSNFTITDSDNETIIIITGDTINVVEPPTYDITKFVGVAMIILVLFGIFGLLAYTFYRLKHQ